MRVFYHGRFGAREDTKLIEELGEENGDAVSGM